MQTDQTVVVNGQQRILQDPFYWILASVLVLAILSASLLNIELLPGVLVDDMLLLTGGVTAGFLFITRNHTLPRIHWSVLLLFGAASLATVLSLFSDTGFTQNSMRGLVSVWWLRIALIGSVAAMISAYPRLIKVVCATAFYCIILTGILVIAMLITSGDDGVLRKFSVLQKTLPNPILKATSLGSANSIMRGVLLLLPLAAWHTRQAPWRLSLLLMLAGITIALTRSRMGFALYSFETILVLFFLTRGVMMRLMVGFVLLGAISIVTAQVSHRLAVISRTQERASDSNVREALWNGSLQLIAEKPLMGFGIGNATVAINQVPDVVRARELRTSHDKVAIHNNLMLYAVESGIGTAVFGLLFFVSVILTSFRAIFRHAPPLRDWFILLSISSIAVFAVMQTATVFRENMIWILLGVILASLAGVAIPRNLQHLQIVFTRTVSSSSEQD